MNPDRSTVDVSLRISEDWMNAYLGRQDIHIPLREGYALVRPALSIHRDGITFRGDFQDKPGSSVEVQARPVWHADSQRFSLEQLKVQTHSSNLWLRSAGWLAGRLMQDKIDQEMETVINDLFRRHLHKLEEGDLHIPIPGQGQARLQVVRVLIKSIDLQDKTLEVAATLEGSWEIELTHRIPGSGPDAGATGDVMS